MKRTISLLLLGALLSACVTSHAGNPPLAFQDLDYSGLDKKPWPVASLPLPGVSERYHLGEPAEISYVELNPEGPRTLIFIHGLGSYLKFWRYQLDAFAAAGYRVIALDMIGYGKSSKPASFPYTMEAMADVVREAAVALHAERPILIGHSMGGQTALSYAIRFPDELSGLVLTSPAGFEAFSRKEKAWFKSVFSTTFVKSTPEEGIWGAIRKNNFYRWKPEHEWLIEERVRLASSPDFDRYAYANVKSVQGLTETDFVRANLDKIKAPTLIVYGAEDRLIPNPFMHGGPTVEIMSFGQAHIQGSRLIGLSGCGHMIQMDCAEEYNRAALEFVSQVVKGRPAEPDPDHMPDGDADLRAGD